MGYMFLFKTSSVIVCCILIVLNRSESQLAVSDPQAALQEDKRDALEYDEYFSEEFLAVMEHEMSFKLSHPIFQAEIDQLQNVYASFLTEIIPYAFSTNNTAITGLFDTFDEALEYMLEPYIFFKREFNNHVGYFDYIYKTLKSIRHDIFNGRVEKSYYQRFLPRLMYIASYF